MDKEDQEDRLGLLDTLDLQITLRPWNFRYLSVTLDLKVTFVDPEPPITEVLGQMPNNICPPQELEVSPRSGLFFLVNQYWINKIWSL